MLDKKTTNDILFNWMLDLRKTKIEPIRKSLLIQSYLEENKIPKRELARLLGIPHTTLEGWLNWSKITEEEKKRLNMEGISDSQIFNALKDKGSVNNIKKVNFYLNKDLETFLSKLTAYEKKTDYHYKTIELINKTKDQLNRILMYMEKSK